MDPTAGAEATAAWGVVPGPEVMPIAGWPPRGPSNCGALVGIAEPGTCCVRTNGFLSTVT